MSRRTLVAALSGAALIVVAALLVRQYAVGSDGYAIFRPVTAAEVESRQEARLIYPGSTRIKFAADDMTPNQLTESGTPADAGGTFAADAPAADVADWYTQKLLGMGWSGIGSDASMGPEIQYGFRKGSREGFYLDIIGPTAVEYVATPHATEYRYFYFVGVPDWWPYFPPF